MKRFYNKANIDINPKGLMFFILTLISIWTVYICLAVDIEYSDGYATISNAQYILGSSDKYFGQRAPFLAFWLTPAEQISQWLGLHPFDIRLHHLSMAVLHIGYLLAVVSMLRLRHDDFYVLLAFIAAIPNYIFFSYVPFVNHDIFPGAILLAMLYLANHLYKQYSHRVWLALVLLGLIASLVKHVYAIFWISILLTYLVILPQRMGLRNGFKAWLTFFSAALASGLISWLLYSWMLQGSIAEVPFLLRPFYQVFGILIMHPNEAHDTIFPWWLYWRNFTYAYGILVTLLIIPGLYFAFKSKSVLMQSTAAAWIIVFMVLSSLDFKEVRYLDVLAPLTALLLVPVLHRIWSENKWKYLQWGLLLVLVIDLSNSLSAAHHSNNIFYRKNIVAEFLEPIHDHPNSRYIFINTLSFTPGDGYSPILGDRNHRLFHVTPEVIRRLYHFTDDKLARLPDFDKINHLRPQDVLFFANTPLVRRPEEYTPMTYTPSKFWQFRLLVIDGETRVPNKQYLQFNYNHEDGTFQLFPAPRDHRKVLFQILDTNK